MSNNKQTSCGRASVEGPYLVIEGKKTSISDIADLRIVKHELKLPWSNFFDFKDCTVEEVGFIIDTFNDYYNSVDIELRKQEIKEYYTGMVDSIMRSGT